MSGTATLYSFHLQLQENLHFITYLSLETLPLFKQLEITFDTSTLSDFCLDFTGARIPSGSCSLAQFLGQVVREHRKLPALLENWPLISLDRL